MRFTQERENFREVVAEALGATTKEGGSSAEAPPESFDELAALISAAGGAVHS